MAEVANTNQPQVTTGNRGLFGRNQPAPEPIAYRFDIQRFITTETTGVKLPNKVRGKDVGPQPKEALFSDPLKTEYTTFLKGYLSNLNAIRDVRPPGGAVALLDTPQHLHDRVLLQRLTTNGLPDVNKIAEFLSKPEGWMIATQVMEHQTALKLFALGLQEVRNPNRSSRHTLAEPIRVHLGIDQGILNRVWNNLSPDQQRALQTVGLGTVVGTGLGTAAGVAIGAIRAVSGAALGPILASVGIGTVGGAAIGAGVTAGAITVNHMVRDGVSLDMDYCAGALRAIQNDPLEKEYVRQMSGIDVDDYIINGAGNVVPNPGRVPQSTNSAEVQMEILMNTISREKFYKSIGVDVSRLDALPEQHLYAYTTGQMEQTGARWQKRTEELFQPNNGGILDAAGLRPVDVGFNPANLDVEGNLRRYMDARRRVIGEMLTELAASENLEDTENSVTRLQNAVGERTNGRLVTDQQTRVRQRIDLIQGVNAGNNSLEIDRQSLQNYSDALGRVQELRAELQAKYGVGTLQEAEQLLASRRNLTVDNLISIRDELRTAESNLAQQQENGRRLDQTFRENEGLFNRFTSAPFTAQGLDQNVLADADLEIILSRVNAVYDAWVAGGRVGPQVGWPATENYDGNRRQDVLRAKSEAQARRVNVYVTPAPPPGHQVDQLITLGYTENQFRLLSPEQMMDVLRSRAGGVPAGWDLPRVTTALNEARERYQARSDTLIRVIESEETLRESYNRYAAAERQRLESQRDQVAANETAVNNLRNPRAIAETILTGNKGDYQGALNYFDTIQTNLDTLVASGSLGAIPPGDRLDRASLAGQSYAEIERRINNANAITVAAGLPPADIQGWPVGLNNLIDINVRRLAFAAAEVQVMNNPLIEAAHPALERVTTTTGVISEAQLRQFTGSAADLIKIINRALPAGDPRRLNNADTGLVELARTIAQQRFDLRARTLASVIEGRTTGPDRDADIKILSLNNTRYQEYRTALLRRDVQRTALGIPANADSGVTEIENRIRELREAQAPPSFATLRDRLNNYNTAFDRLQNVRARINSLPGIATAGGLEGLIRQRELQSDTDFETAITELRTAEQTLENRNATVRTAVNVMNEMANQFNQIGDPVNGVDMQLAAVGIAPVFLDDTSLRRETFDELIQRVNRAYTAGRAVAPPAGPLNIGWPERDNGRQNLRMRLAHAIAEARARQISAAIAAPSVDLTTVRGAATDTQIMFSTVDELITRVNNAAGIMIYNPAIGADRATIQGVINDARGVFDARSRALEETSDANNIRIGDLNEEFGRVPSTFDAQREYLNTTVEMLNRQQEIFNGARFEFIDNFDQFTNRAAVPNTDINFSQAERTSGYPYGYYRIIQMMFNYQNNPTINREQFIQRIHRVLPPNVLAQALKSLGIGAAPATLENVFLGMQVYRDTINRVNIRQSFRYLMDAYRRAAVAAI